MPCYPPQIRLTDRGCGRPSKRGTLGVPGNHKYTWGYGTEWGTVACSKTLRRQKDIHWCRYTPGSEGDVLKTLTALYLLTPCALDADTWSDIEHITTPFHNIIRWGCSHSKTVWQELLQRFTDTLQAISTVDRHEAITLTQSNWMKYM